MRSITANKSKVDSHVMLQDVETSPTLSSVIVSQESGYVYKYKASYFENGGMAGNDGGIRNTRVYLNGRSVTSTWLGVHHPSTVFFTVPNVYE